MWLNATHVQLHFNLLNEKTSFWSQCRILQMNNNANKYMAKTSILEFRNRRPIYKQICINKLFTCFLGKKILLKGVQSKHVELPILIIFINFISSKILHYLFFLTKYKFIKHYIKFIIYYFQSIKSQPNIKEHYPYMFASYPKSIF